MSIKLLINLSKKVPGPTDYSSIQASCSIEGELLVGQDTAAECARLYAQAEAAVDRQLGITAGKPDPAHVPTPLPASTANSQPPQPSGRSQYPSSGARRAQASISAAQLRFLRQLCDRTPGAIDRILADHRIGQLEDLTSRSASAVIDSLKTPSP